MNSATNENSFSMKEAVQVLYPSRVKSPYLSSIGKNNQRFTELLLEYGERHLQDWAVVASSSVQPDSSTDLLKQQSFKRTEKTSRQSSSLHGKRNGKNNHAISRRSHIRERSNMCPSTCMHSVEGRLRLCSRSLVFEPNDISRGIIRCPLDRMEKAPYAASKENSSSAHVKDANTEHRSMPGMNNGNEINIVVVVKSTRHFVMKANNVIAPFKTETNQTEFQFSFLHSTPQKFFELSNTLWSMVTSSKSSSTSLDEIIRPMLDRPFDPSNFSNVREKPATNNLRCSIISPLLSTPGCSIVTNERIYFQPAIGIFSSTATKASSWSLDEIVAIARRYYGLKDSAIEIFFNRKPSVLLAYENISRREQVVKSLKLPANIPFHTDRDFVIEAARAWKENKITNFEYLLALNSASGRTFHDLSRYPVFPWVIADYTGTKLDLTQITKTFRDLTKPIGALNKERLENFQDRLESMKEMENPFLYGTHYSAPGYVLYYLVRNMPEHMLCLQNGKFDSADRLFYSIDHCFTCLLTNPADIKESIPEFYDPSAGYDFLINASGLQMGTTQTGIHVNDVILPPWARSPKDFLKKNKRALESEYCSKMLPRWIDLIFGVKSRGKMAEEAMNLFHPSAYMTPADLELLPTPEERIQAELQATEFGIIPDLIFCKDHPSKGDMEKLDSSVTPDLGRYNNEFEFIEEEHDSMKQRDQWEILQAPENNINRDTDLDTKVPKHGTSPTKSIGFENIPSLPSKSMSFEAVQSVSSSETMSQRTKQFEGGKAFQDKSTLLSASSTKEQSAWAFNRSQKKEILLDINPRDGIIDQTSNLSLRGTGYANKNDHSYTNSGTFNDKETENSANIGIKSFDNSGPSHVSPKPTTSQHGWELKSIALKQMHGDAVSGCHLALHKNDRKNSYIVTISLDGGLHVHKLPLSHTDHQQSSKLRGFAGSSTFSRFSAFGTTPESNEPKFHSFRSHSSGDPLACLSVLSDNSEGYIAFAGGHDDIVLAYGINSACALSSVYSHRDAVTGIDIIPFAQTHLQISESGTHLMVSGSWDATVKLWSVIIDGGETVSINRDPVDEFYDADCTIISVALVEVEDNCVAVCAGCSDGSLVVWIRNSSGGQKILLKEVSRRDYGPCATIRCIANPFTNEKFIFAGYGNGKIVSFTVSKDLCRPVSKLNIGSSVQCITIIGNTLFAGCADGGLRLVPLGDGAHFDYNPRLWRSIHGEKSPGITSVSAQIEITETNERQFLCATGAEDGSVKLFSVEEAASEL